VLDPNPLPFGGRVGRGSLRLFFKGEGNIPSLRKSALLFALALMCAPGASPVWAKETGLIFVSNEKTNNVIAIDPATYKVVQDIKVARRPRDMHFSADHSKL